jgi:hypothetical protein
LSDGSSGWRARLGTLTRSLDAEQQLAGIAALGILASLFTPWWRDPVFRLSSWAVNHFTFIEFSLVLVAGSVLLLLYRRAQRRVFHLPLSDGILAAGAGLWCCLLVVVRALEPPTRSVRGHALDYDARWGMLLCLGFAVLLVVAGIRGRRRYHRGEPEAVAADADAQPTVPLPRYPAP